MTEESQVPHEVTEWNAEIITEQIWVEMQGTVPRPLIRQVIAEVTPKFESARIKTFVHIFLHRQVVTQLRASQVKDII